MARAASATLVWLPEQGAYALREAQNPDENLVRDSEQWFNWLDARRSFSFHGAAGQISLLKEARAGSRAGYWYAYRRQGPRTRKQYAGRTAELSFSHLEAIAAALCPPPAPAATPETQAQSNVSPAAAPNSPLLAPKLQIPRLPPALIARERLFAALDAGRRQVLTLLCAPPGYGKTTLVRQWLASLAERQKAKGKMKRLMTGSFCLLPLHFYLHWRWHGYRSTPATTTRSGSGAT